MANNAKLTHELSLQTSHYNFWSHYWTAAALNRMQLHLEEEREKVQSHRKKGTKVGAVQLCLQWHTLFLSLPYFPSLSLSLHLISPAAVHGKGLSKNERRCWK